jgi:glucose-6-phosphate isomerase
VSPGGGDALGTGQVSVSTPDAENDLAELQGVADRLTNKDAGLWGPDAEEEARVRLGWLDLPTSSQELLPRLNELRDSLRASGLDHVVLAGMGGSSLAPEVIARTTGTDLTVLDTTDPHQIRAALADRLDRTILVVSSKSGSTVETDSHRRAFEKAFRDLGLSDDELARRIVVVTDPGSALEESARTAGYQVVLADPNVGGRYSALSAFGLVPTVLAGVDVEGLLVSARALQAQLGGDTDNPGLLLGAAIGGGAKEGRDKLVIADTGSGIVGFGDWAEQLVAESTGKQGTGVLPVVVEGTDAPGFADAGKDAHRVVLGRAPAGFDGTAVAGPLGAQFLLWEYATAVTGKVLGIDPFDQPNVAESKENTQKLLDQAGDGPLPEGEPLCTDGSVAVYGDPGLLGDAKDLRSAITRLLDTVPGDGYLAVMAYLDRFGDKAAAGLRPALARRLDGRQVTFGWGPRFLHSTGQFHKGGPQNQAFLQITGAVTGDLEVPGRPYTFGRLQLAQALGDLGALTERGRPAVRVHLLDRADGVAQLLDACEDRG